MAGHSHWAGIKYRKAAADAKRGKIFSKVARQIMVAVREGGGDPESNLALKYAIEKARSVNMPKDKIERAIKKAAGDGEGGRLVEIVYEGYAPGGVAVLVETLTDNRNRTTSEVRHVFERRGGSLSGKGSVAWMFELRGMLMVDAEKVSEEAVLELAVEADVEDVRREGGMWEILCAPRDLERIKGVFSGRGVTPKVAELARVPKDTVELDAAAGRKVLQLLNELEDLDDVQHVWANFDIPEEVVEREAGD